MPHLLVVLMTREEERDEVVRKLLIYTPVLGNQEKHIYYVMRAEDMHVVWGNCTSGTRMFFCSQKENKAINQNIFNKEMK